MLPAQIDPSASFATAFKQVNMPWGSYLVGLGAVLGIVTGVLVSKRCLHADEHVCALAALLLTLPWH